MKAVLRIVLASTAMLGVCFGSAFAQTATDELRVETRGNWNAVVVASPPISIYDDALAPGWNNWSWAEVEIGATISDPEERPISVRAQGWQALYLQHAAFSTTGYSELTFFIHGGAAGGQTISVIAVDARGEPIDRFFRVVPEANAWTEVHVPLSEIGASDTSITGFFIQNGTPEPTRRFLVNEIALR
ncbi:MAG: hypothetical protein WDM79_03810 [Terricaulis sp.]